MDRAPVALIKLHQKPKTSPIGSGGWWNDAGLGGYMWIRFDSRGVGFPEGQRAGMPRNANDRRRFLDSDSVYLFCIMSVRRGRGLFPLKPLLCLSDRYNLACLAPNGVHWFSAYLRRWALLATQLEPMIRAIIQCSNCNCIGISHASTPNGVCCWYSLNYS